MVPDVRAALKNKGTKIVTKEWLHESIQANTVLKTAKYELKQTAEDRAKERKRQQKEKARKGESIDEGEFCQHNFFGLTASHIHIHTYIYMYVCVCFYDNNTLLMGTGRPLAHIL